MSNLLKHGFVSAKADGADATQVQPSHWNAGHVFTGGTVGDVLTRAPADPFGANWVAPVGWVPYSPAWYIGTGPVIPGNHQVSGFYHRRGDAVWFSVFHVVGTDPIPGGQFGYSLPVQSASLISPAVGLLLQSGGAVYPLFSDAFGLSTYFRTWYLTPGAASLSALTGYAPAGLTASWYLEMRGNYQAAPGAFAERDERPAPEGGPIVA